jgi:S1-C subfamily serine protease
MFAATVGPKLTADTERGLATMATALSELSDAITALVAQASRSLVAIDARRRFPASGIVYSSDGIIVTNHHVIHRDTDIRVHLPDGSIVAGELAGRDEANDVAVVRVDATGLEEQRWTGHEGLKVGGIVVAVGNPGTGPRAALGLLSSVAGAWRTRTGGELDAFIETDLPIFAGFSGSPLYDADGAVIGINTSALLRGASVTIPHATVARSVATLLEHGRIPQGYLGVSSYPVDLPESEAGGESAGRGLLVVSVEADSPAEKAGIIIGDIIIAVAGNPTRGAETLRSSLGSATIGQSVEVAIIRGGRTMSVSATIEARG